MVLETLLLVLLLRVGHVVAMQSSTHVIRRVLPVFVLANGAVRLERRERLLRDRLHRRGGLRGRPGRCELAPLRVDVFLIRGERLRRRLRVDDIRRGIRERPLLQPELLPAPQKPGDGATGGWSAG